MAHVLANKLPCGYGFAPTFCGAGRMDFATVANRRKRVNRGRIVAESCAASAGLTGQNGLASFVQAIGRVAATISGYFIQSLVTFY
jgi:hypothetical protein